MAKSYVALSLNEKIKVIEDKEKGYLPSIGLIKD
jgi:hypothetical protein